MNVEVTQKDIDEGLPYEPNRCAVALAFYRALGLDWLEAHQSWVEYKIGSVCYRADLPVEARNFIHKFDRGYYVEPFSFTIEPKECQ